MMESQNQLLFIGHAPNLNDFEVSTSEEQAKYIKREHMEEDDRYFYLILNH